MHQKRLLNHLFRDYDYLERPVAEEFDNLTVHVGLAVQQIVDVDEKKQTIIFSGWLDMVSFFIQPLMIFSLSKAVLTQVYLF